MLAFLFLCLCLQQAAAFSRYTGNELPGEVSYDGDALLNVKIKSIPQYLALKELYEDQDLHIDLWTDLKIGPVEVLVPRDSLQTFQKSKLSYDIIVEDVQAAIDARNQKRKMPNNSTWFEDYHDLDEIKQWMADLIQTYPTLASKLTFGTSYLGEEIEIMKISSGKASKAIIYHGGQHSNEWVGVTVVSYIIDQLLSGYGNDPQVTRLVDGYDWYIAPVLNVDGYRYTWTTNSAWRKNRQPNQGSTCVGIDTNRNWPYKWNTGGSSSEPCSNTYHGPEPFFAPEPKAVSDFVESIQNSGKEVVSYIDWHCCGLMWMNPWGYTCDEYSKDHEELVRVGKIASDTAFAVHGVRYDYGSICEVIYLASGNSVDHVHGNLNVTYTFANEMRSNSQFNPSLIIPNGEEMWAAVKAYTSDILGF